MMHARLSVLDAPSNLGLRPPPYGGEPGCRLLPEVLRAAGLLQALAADDAGRIDVPPYHPEPELPSGVRNAANIVAFSSSLADRIGELLDDGRFPMVLGGDCSILLGSLLALRRRGRFGLVSVDGGLDFRHPGNAELAGGYGAAAGEHLALVTGRGHRDLANLEGRAPLVRDEDVVAMGHRDLDEFEREVRQLPFALWNVARLRREGLGESARHALTHLDALPMEGFWVHVDADVLDPDVMPAVDSPEPDGLDLGELTQLLRVLAQAPGCIGLQLTIYDPLLDPGHRLAGRLVDVLRGALIEDR